MISSYRNNDNEKFKEHLFYFVCMQIAVIPVTMLLCLLPLFILDFTINWVSKMVFKNK
jgi:hypothetical protein